LERHPERGLPPVEAILADTECYATMEPCSYRTSGGPSCALELVDAKVKTVYLVSLPRWSIGAMLMISVGSRGTTRFRAVRGGEDPSGGGSPGA
jgi:hypothetical protein